jgi:cadmium resistance protein CadD (predicted permease)
MFLGVIKMTDDVFHLLFGIILVFFGIWIIKSEPKKTGDETQEIMEQKRKKYKQAIFVLGLISVVAGIVAIIIAGYYILNPIPPVL